MVVDVTALDVLDSFATRTIRGIAYIAKLRGAETVVVGIQPEVAFAMVQLGLALDGVATALDLEEGLELLRRTERRRRRRDALRRASRSRRDVDIVTARQKGREIAAASGFSGTDQTLIATAISEVARNIVSYAGAARSA